jgi:hypothetical protein
MKINRNFIIYLLLLVLFISGIILITGIIKPKFLDNNSTKSPNSISVNNSAYLSNITPTESLNNTKWIRYYFSDDLASALFPKQPMFEKGEIKNKNNEEIVKRTRLYLNLDEGETTYINEKREYSEKNKEWMKNLTDAQLKEWFKEELQIRNEEWKKDIYYIEDEGTTTKLLFPEIYIQYSEKDENNTTRHFYEKITLSPNENASYHTTYIYLISSDKKLAKKQHEDGIKFMNSTFISTQPHSLLTEDEIIKIKKGLRETK